MAVATISYTNITPGVETDGQRSIEATINFSTPGTDTYTTTGIPLNLAALGLVKVTKSYEIKWHKPADPYVDPFITLAQWKTEQTTTTFSWFIDTATNATALAPRMVIWAAGAEQAAAAIPASWSGIIRARFVGSS